MTQVVLDTLLRTSQISLLAVGLTLVYSLLRFPNFAHVEFAVIGGYVGMFLTVTVGLPLVLAIVIAILIAGLTGIAMDRAVFKRLRNSTPIQMMIASFGLSIAIRGVVLAIWGSSPRSYELGLQTPLHVLGGTLTPTQVWILIIATASMVGFYLLLKFTRLGMAMRATADNAGLASASAIYTERVITTVWFLGAAYAGLAGVFIGLDTQLFPRMGFGIIIPVFCAAIVGGIGNPYGAVAGAFIIGLAENAGLAIDWQPILGLFGYEGQSAYIAASWRNAIPFVLLILALLFRPQGLFAKPAR